MTTTPTGTGEAEPTFTAGSLTGADFDAAGRLINATGGLGGPGHDPAAVAAVVVLVALLRRVDTFMAEVAATISGATSGGLLGLLTGGRR